MELSPVQPRRHRDVHRHRALSHDTFDAAVYLGICDKIVPGLLMGALAFGPHLPAVFVPAGPMTTGIPNKEKARTRQRYAEGQGHAPGAPGVRGRLLSRPPATCTFYGTANSNQMLMEIMGLHLPGAAFVNPGTELRGRLTDAAAERALALGAARGEEYTPVGRVIDERAIVNGICGLLATGGLDEPLTLQPGGDGARRRHRRSTGTTSTRSPRRCRC